MTNQKDEYDKAVSTLHGLVSRLFGGHDDPKSDRDYELAIKLHDFLIINCPDSFVCVNGIVFDKEIK